MKITIVAPHMEVTEGLKEAVNDATKRFSKHIEAKRETNEHDRENGHKVKPLEVKVTLSVEGNVHRVDMLVHDTGNPFVTTVRGNDMYAGINKAAQNIDRQWRKRKTDALASRTKVEPLKKMGM